MPLNDQLALIQVLSIGVGVEVPNRNILYLRHGFYNRVLVALFVPVGILFVHRKWTFEDAGAE